MAKSDRSRAAEQNRRKKANQLNPAAHDYYRDYWDDVRHIADVEDVAGEWDHRAEERTALQLLEYAGIDALVDTHKTQLTIQEKFVEPDTNGDSLLIRMDNGSDSVWSGPKNSCTHSISRRSSVRVTSGSAKQHRGPSSSGSC